MRQAAKILCWLLVGYLLCAITVVMLPPAYMVPHKLAATTLLFVIAAFLGVLECLVDRPKE